MKKLFSVALIACMAISLGACYSSSRMGSGLTVHRSIGLFSPSVSVVTQDAGGSAYCDPKSLGCGQQAGNVVYAAGSDGVGTAAISGAGAAAIGGGLAIAAAKAIDSDRINVHAEGGKAYAKGGNAYASANSKNINVNKNYNKASASSKSYGSGKKHGGGYGGGYGGGHW